MTQQEVVDLINEPTETVIEKTKEELADYIDDEEYFNVGGVVDMINEKIRAKIPVRDSEAEYPQDTYTAVSEVVDQPPKSK